MSVESRRTSWWHTLFLADDSAARNFLLVATVLLVIGILEGLTLAFQFVFPDLFRGAPALVFGRLRQGHTNMVIIGFLSAGMMGLWHYVVPRLTGRRLWSEALGNVSMALWTVATLVGVGLLLEGHTQSREYAELVWGIDVAVMVVLIINLINFYMTIANRTEPKLYVSLWYISGTLIWFPMLYFIGNVMWNPPTGALTGIDDAIFNWFYGHNILGLWFTTGMLPIIYYIVPRETHTPLYSHFLSLIAFWGIALFYTGVGGHHLLWAPIPYWLKTIAVAESIGMILPVIAFMANIWLTMRGNWNRFFSSLPLRFAITGFAAYVLVSYQGSHQALRSINLLTHFTQYVPAHAHLSLLFFVGSVIMGGTYYALPRIYNCQLFSRGLANVSYWLYSIGFVFFLSGFLLVGLVQGTSWLHQGLPVWTVLPGLRPYMALRAAGGAVLWTGFILWVVNIWATVIVRRPIVQPDFRTKGAAGALPATTAG
jgi:cbb3-type cytochrome c oxidase subunit I